MRTAASPRLPTTSVLAIRRTSIAPSASISASYRRKSELPADEPIDPARAARPNRTHRHMAATSTASRATPPSLFSLRRDPRDKRAEAWREVYGREMLRLDVEPLADVPLR